MTDAKDASPSDHTSTSTTGEDSGPDRTGFGGAILRWGGLVLGVVLFGMLMRSVLYPYPNQSYAEIAHGDHTHYVPKDRNDNVPVSNFPTQEPGPDERITPDGDIISKK
ncbi:hypothetical protein GGQ07_000066 [Salinibacter ruber]|jgi:hypothetical protein|uniref:Uncharacterized protein n=3 Tax=Salinibacter ruber TaxID=146919 RepID=A0A9X2TEG0_9BACT|nr:hypothetical protein [Salinibacter ruber]MCS3676307.1 hypothetical protein [Salinibacter ruber]MCS4096949.1 hypothetical protein [Salinibacter ruber]MCS4178654.1 hypothetical protein [Salinibacter ruber]